MSSKQARDPTNTLENQPTTRRHARDDPDRPDATDVHNPHARDDPDTPGFFTRITPSTWGQWSALFIVGSIFVGFVLYVTRLYPPGYHNPYVLAIGVLVAIFPAWGLFMREQGFKARSLLDTVVVKLGDPTTGLRAMITLGEVETGASGYVLEKEVKRTTFGGFVGGYLKMEDVMHEDDLRLDSKRHRDPDNPARLELDERFTAWSNTDLHGDVYVTDAGDIDYDFESKNVERRTTEPRYVDQSDTGMLIQELKFSQEREQAARDEIDVIHNRLEDMRKRVEDEKQPELDAALSVLKTLRNDTLAPRPQRSQILPEEESSVVDEIDKQVDEDMPSE